MVQVRLLLMQGIQVQSLLQEDSTYWGATQPRCPNYGACALRFVSHMCLEPVLCNKRSHRNEKPEQHKE